MDAINNKRQWIAGNEKAISDDKIAGSKWVEIKIYAVINLARIFQLKNVFAFYEMPMSAMMQHIFLIGS